MFGVGTLEQSAFDAASGGSFLSLYEEEAMELIEKMVLTSQRNATKSLRSRSTMVRGGSSMDAKAAETGQLWERMEKITEIQNLLIDRLNVKNGNEGLAPEPAEGVSACAHCSSLEHAIWIAP